MPAPIRLPWASPVTATGTEKALVVPSPSWPLPFAPQQSTAPLLRIAQVCWAPTVSAIGSVTIGTRAGVSAGSSLACASWPLPFPPQQKRPAARVAAQLCEKPTPAAVTAVSPGTRTGRR